MALNANALITVADVKTYLGISASTWDTLIERLINAASDQIERFCDRQFVKQTYREWVTPGRRSIRLRQWPVQAVVRVAYGAAPAITIDASTSTDLRATVEVQDDALVLTRYDSDGTAAATSLAFATYKTTGTLATQVSATTGWSATSNASVLCLDLFRAQGGDALTSSVILHYPDLTTTQWRVDEDTGILTLHVASEYGWPDEYGNGGRHDREWRSVLVEYTAGVFTSATPSSVPADLAQACAELVQFRFQKGQKDSSVTSERLGDYSYTLGTGSEALDNEPGGWSWMRTRLAPWMERP